MPDNIPLELQVEIIKRVPVKSLLQFRSVSKEWKAVIDSPNFGDDYCLRHSQPHRLLIRFRLSELSIMYFSIAADDGDDTLHLHQFPLLKSVNNIKHSRIVGCSHGLFCLYPHQILSYYYGDRSYMVVLWSPWIRKFVHVPVPNVVSKPYETILGFGVCPQIKDPMIVKINSFHGTEIDTSVPIPWRVEVFTLSSGTWKTPSCSGNNLPSRNSIIFQWSQVALDGVIYWLAYERIKVDGIPRFHNLIMSFDLSSEGFQEVCLPDNLTRLNLILLSISKRMESVVVLEMDETRTSYGVWMMGQGVNKSFTKLFNVISRGSSPYCRLHGFLKNGEPIVDHGSDALFAYDPYSERIKDLGTVGISGSLSATLYMETLLFNG